MGLTESAARWRSRGRRHTWGAILGALLCATALLVAVPYSDAASVIAAVTTRSCESALAEAEALGGHGTVSCFGEAESGGALTPFAPVASVSSYDIVAWCDTHPGDWWYYRQDACRDVRITLYILDVKTRAVLGSVKYDISEYIYVGNGSTNALQYVFVTPVAGSATGVGSTARFDVDMRCIGQCTMGSSTDIPPTPYPSAGDGQWFFNATITGTNQVRSFQPIMTLTATTPNTVVPGVWVDEDFDVVRCDTQHDPFNGAPGCAFPAYWPVVSWSTTGPYAEVAQHIYDAQASGLPGAYGSTRPLRRLTNPYWIDVNRQLACPDSLTRPPGKSCDEYPFASTREGAGTSGGFFSRRMVDEDQNSLHGSDLGMFYQSDRVLDGDPFWVRIIPGSGEAYFAPIRSGTGGSTGTGTPWPPPGTYLVDTFANAPGYASPTSTTQTGTLYAGTNYVYCKLWGPEVRVGDDYNHWWLKTDLDTGSPWQNQYVSAYYLSRWGNDVAKDNAGTVIPTCSESPPPPPPASYWVDTFANAAGFSSPTSTTQTGTLYAGTNYVYCKAWGREVRNGDSYNHWWLKTDLDTGSPWQNQYVSAYYLTRWGNDVAKDNNGTVIPTCPGGDPPPPPTKYWVDTFANAPGFSSPTSTTQTGTLYAGTNYVYCKVWGRQVGSGSSYNHWWLRTDLDTGSPWQNQYVSAYYLSRWGNDEARDNNGTVIPNC